MDSEYQAQLTEQLRTLRRLQHTDQMTQARAGYSADPALTLRIEDRAKEIRDIEALLGVERPVTRPTPQPTYRRVEPVPEPVFRERVVNHSARQRQQDIEHQITLLGIHRCNLAHYREQAKAFGGVALAPPMTRNGMNEARSEIARIKGVLRDYGEHIDDLAGDE